MRSLRWGGLFRVPLPVFVPAVSLCLLILSPEALCERGLSQFEKGDLRGAEQSLRRAVATNPQLPVARSTLGRVLAKAERYDEAAVELRQAVELDPTDAAGSYVLGFALRKLGQNVAAAARIISMLAGEVTAPP